jgi:hypothetical protein
VLGNAPADLVNLASQRGHGPSGQQPWVKGPWVQKVLLLVFYFRKLQNLVESCKNHRIFSVYQKNENDLSKCSEK